jgi:hypothetical protein
LLAHYSGRGSCGGSQTVAADDLIAKNMAGHVAEDWNIVSQVAKTKEIRASLKTYLLCEIDEFCKPSV